MGIRVDILKFLQQLEDAIGGFIKQECSRNWPEGFQPVATLSGFVWEKTDEMELIGREPAGRQGRNQSAWPRDCLDTKSSGNGGSDNTLTGIADARTARVRYQGDFLAGAEPVEDLLTTAGFVELEVAEEGL